MHRLPLLTAVLLLALQSPRSHANYARPPFLREKMDPISWMTTPQLVLSRGYSVELHDVETADGYVLTLHRVPPRRRQRGQGQPVLFGHGLGSCSEQWVVRTGNSSLAFLLADNGFDVWLANYRGNFYGRRHVTRSVKSHKFWDFSWHENSVYDQAAMIDYILAVTGRRALLTVGHSMGGSVQMVLHAERPEYNDKVLAHVALAPPTFFAHPSGLLHSVDELFKMQPSLKEALSTNIINDALTVTGQPLVVPCLALGRGCRRLYELAVGQANEPVDAALLATFMSHYSAGASIRQVMHYAQSILSGGDFRRYDFGPLKNKLIYGSAIPPAYNLSKITSPMYVYYSMTDNLVHYKDAEMLATKLPSLKRLHRIPLKKFNHIDYLLGKTISEDLNKYVLEDLNKHILK